MEGLSGNGTVCLYNDKCVDNNGGCDKEVKHYDICVKNLPSWLARIVWNFFFLMTLSFCYGLSFFSDIVWIFCNDALYINKWQKEKLGIMSTFKY